MSPRRKSGLSAEDLRALEHLPAVLRALEHLQQQHAKVRALMGVRVVEDPTMPPGMAHLGPVTIKNIGLDERAQERAVAFGDDLAPGLGSGRLLKATPILNTPERREYEAAKKAGKPIPALPDPFANATPEQLARMEEQRAFLASQGRGKPAPRIIITDAEPEPVGGEAIVREEALDTISDGTNQFNPPPEAVHG